MTGDWSDSRVVTNTDRTLTSIQLIEKIERLEKENKRLKEFLNNYDCRFDNDKEKQDFYKAVDIFYNRGD